MGIAKKARHCLKAIYLNLSELTMNFFIKHSRSVAGKLVEINKPPENLSITGPSDRKHPLTRPFGTASNNACIG